MKLERVAIKIDRTLAFLFKIEKKSEKKAPRFTLNRSRCLPELDWKRMLSGCRRLPSENYLYTMASELFFSKGLLHGLNSCSPNATFSGVLSGVIRLLIAKIEAQLEKKRKHRGRQRRSDPRSPGPAVALPARTLPNPRLETSDPTVEPRRDFCKISLVVEKMCF